MSPILVRPVREQLEHDRIIRLLQNKLRRRYDIAINPGAEKNASVDAGTSPLYPDLVLTSQDRARRIEAVIEVETGESVNHLEALAQWMHLSKVRAAFHLYVPSGMMEVARRLCEDNQIHLDELWSYHTIGDDIRFALVQRSRETVAPAPSARRPSAVARPKARPAVKRTARSAKPPRRAAAPKPTRTQKRK
jgi:hypothetical protein